MTAIWSAAACMLVLAACGGSGNGSATEAATSGNQTGITAATSTPNSSEETNAEDLSHQGHDDSQSSTAPTEQPVEAAGEQTDKPSPPNKEETKKNSDADAAQTPAKGGKETTPPPAQDKDNVSKPTSTPAVKAEGGSGGKTPASSKPTDPPAAAPASVTHVVEIKDFAFSIAELEIKVGDKVKFINRDNVEHTATADDNSFDTGLFGEGEEKVVTFDKEGDFGYYCAPHPGMKASIKVTAG